MQAKQSAAKKKKDKLSAEHQYYGRVGEVYKGRLVLHTGHGKERGGIGSWELPDTPGQRADTILLHGLSLSKHPEIIGAKCHLPILRKKCKR